MSEIKKSILVISEGAPPIGDNLVEGGGLRNWGIAKGLVKNGHEVTLAYQDTYLVKDTALSSTLENLNIETWNEKNISNLIPRFSHIIFSYALGQAPLFLQSIREDQILILDCYVPITIEVAARRSVDRLMELSNYTNDLQRWKEVLRRGDYFMYASHAQLHYYLGYLSSINRLNPFNYHDFESRLIELPYGIDKDEAIDAELSREPATLLWYGGFYPWFDIESLVDSLVEVKKRVAGFKFIVAGALNPYNQNPDFKAHYSKSIEALGRLGDSVEMIDWTPYHQRLAIYGRATAIATVNMFGLENELAWRTRLMDFVLAKRPILTNAGDPLGEDLIKRGVAHKVDMKDAASLVKAFEQCQTDVEKHRKYEDAINAYDWKYLTSTLDEAIINGSRLVQPYFERKLTLRVGIKIATGRPIAIAKYIKRNGIRQTKNKIKQKISG